MRRADYPGSWFHVFSLFFFTGFPVEHVPFGASLDNGTGIGSQPRFYFSIDFSLQGQLGCEHPFNFSEDFAFILLETAQRAFLERPENQMRQMTDLILTHHHYK